MTYWPRRTDFVINLATLDRFNTRDGAFLQAEERDAREGTERGTREAPARAVAPDTGAARLGAILPRAIRLVSLGTIDVRV